MGALLTDFKLIKTGALHRANGGYLVLDARRLLQQPFAWEALKRALVARCIRIESISELFSLISTVSLEPELRIRESEGCASSHCLPDADVWHEGFRLRARASAKSGESDLRLRLVSHRFQSWLDEVANMSNSIIRDNHRATVTKGPPGRPIETAFCGDQSSDVDGRVRRRCSHRSLRESFGPSRSDRCGRLLRSLQSPRNSLLTSRSACCV